MKKQKDQHHHKTVHQLVEETCRHKAAIGVVGALTLMSVVAIDVRFRDILKDAYAEGWGFLSAYVRHEHPSHFSPSITIARLPKISSQ